MHTRSAVVVLLALTRLAGPATAQEGPPLRGGAESELPRAPAVRTERALAGATLVAPLRSTKTYLVGLDGQVLHRWDSQFAPGNAVELLDDGRLIRSGREGNDAMGGGGQGGRFEELSFDGELLWSHAVNDETYLAHHDFAVLPNGNLLVIAWERLDRETALALGRDPDQVGDEGLWPDAVLELRPTRPSGAEVVWSWHAADHLVQDRDPRLAGHGDVPAEPGRIDVNADHRDDRPLTEEERERARRVREQMEALGYVDTSLAGNARRAQGEGPVGGDLLHTNSIDHHPELDLILLSVRTLGEIWIIDHSTTPEEARGSTGGRRGHGGRILYRWGNPRTYGHGTAADQRLFGQHDATFVPGRVVDAATGARDLRVLVFNNGAGRPDGEYATVEELVLPFDPERGFVREEGEPFGPSEPAWVFGAREDQRFEASFVSGAQRLPNGSTLVCQGPAGRLFEVDAEGAVLWDWTNPFGGDAPQGPPGGPGGERRGPGARPGGPPPGGPPPGARPPRRDGAGPGPGGRGGPGGLATGALFRATRIPSDHPALSRLAPPTAGNADE